MYRIDHDHNKWEVGSAGEEIYGQNVFKGHQHQTDGLFDWAYKHHRMCDPDNSRFHLDFDLPDYVKT